MKMTKCGPVTILSILICSLTSSLALAAQEPRISTSRKIVTYESHTTANVAVILYGKFDSVITVDYTTRDGSAIAHTDYKPMSGTMTFNPGENRRKFLPIGIQEDSDIEKAENLYVEFSNPTGATITNHKTTVVIVDSAPPHSEIKLEESSRGALGGTITNIAPSIIEAPNDYPEAAGLPSMLDLDPPGVPNEQFRIFNTMLYRNMPKVGARAPLVYEKAFFGENDPLPDGTPSPSGISTAVAGAQSQFGPPWNADADLVIIDIERWKIWPFVDHSEHRAAIARYSKSVSAFGDAYPIDICLYAIAPQAGINHAIESTSSAFIRQQWTRASEATRELIVPQVSALCPSLYTYYDSDKSSLREKYIEEWIIFARETIREARRIAPDKPVYTFLWPQFHGGGNMDGFDFLPDEYWQAQLETVRKYADGLILWGGWDFDTSDQLDWNNEASWWKVFKTVFPDH